MVSKMEKINMNKKIYFWKTLLKTVLRVDQTAGCTRAAYQPSKKFNFETSHTWNALSSALPQVKYIIL